jgi:hypothetical protein
MAEGEPTDKSKVYKASLVLEIRVKDPDSKALKAVLVKQVRKALERQKYFIKPGNVLEIFRPVEDNDNDS